jgi:citrate lyase subunit beta/citryl-CoA lyase
MLDSYFFIPGDNKRFIDKIPYLSANYFIIDLEDSVSESKKELAFTNAIDLHILDNYFVRIPLDSSYSLSQIMVLIDLYNGRVVLPKFTLSAINLEILDLIKYKNSVIILIESTKGLLKLEDILEQKSDIIKAIGFGSYDFCSSINIKHDYNKLLYYRQQIILVAHAYSKEYIDGVSFDIDGQLDFLLECTEAFAIGASGKFMIHPKQIELNEKIEYFDQEEVEHFKKALLVLDNMNIEEVGIIKIDGKVYERPHINWLRKMTNKLKKQNKL